MGFFKGRSWLAPLLALVTACGSQGGSSPPPLNPARGQLIDSPPTRTASVDAASLLILLGTSNLGKYLLDQTYTPRCDLDVYRIEYRTVDPAGNLTPASGTLMVPRGADPVCTGSRPLLLYAHGTSTDRNYDLGDVVAGNSTEGVMLAAVFASQGYIVVAPEYVGYGNSTLGYHPYLVADQQSRDMIDALSAARSALPVASAPSTTDGGKLFITGYSQGGFVAMATQRAMQDAGQVVTAAAPMSGPYALSAFGDAIFEGQVSNSAAVNFALLVNSYQHVYGNVFASPGDLFEAKYAASMKDLLPSTTSVGDLQAQGKLPSALFDSVPPDASWAAFTPATEPANLAGVFAAGFAPDHLITNAYRLSYLTDAKAAPDGGFPNVSDGLPPANPGNALRQDLKANDLRNWVPTAPVLLCGGDSDPTVFFFNTVLMQQYWTAHPPPIAPVILDLDAGVAGSDPYSSQKTGFQAAKAAVRAAAILGGATDGGDQAVLDEYHAGLVPPFCVSAVKAFFDAH